MRFYLVNNSSGYFFTVLSKGLSIILNTRIINNQNTLQCVLKYIIKKQFQS
jgi:hypothetical protein